MKVPKGFAVIVMILAAVIVLSSLSLAQEKRKIKLSDYRIQLAEWQQREAEAKIQIAQLQKDIDSLKTEIAKVEGQIQEQWAGTYAMLGTEETGVNEFAGCLTDLENQVEGLNALSPEELFDRRAEIDSIEQKLNEVKATKIALLSEMQDRIATIEGKLTTLKARMPEAVYDTYTVVKGDYLWKISKKPDIYNDPLQWMKIYTYNRDQIKNPDLIYPEQVFKIVRKLGPNEYMVVKGDFLRKIAENPEVFGDPTKWTKLYEANKQVITDKNLIYPYQILVIPRD
ncbi:LysM peptidoglycan-binding domain-containing protein [bacterium]|nr:LysM peptidoglycan-binding domain-containing protein [bacterium]